MPERVGLTRARVISKIRSLTRQKGYAPTFRELGDELGVSMNTAHYWLNVLKKEGLVTYKPGVARTLRIKKGA